MGMPKNRRPDPYRDGMAKYHAREQVKHDRRNKPLHDKIAKLEKQVNSQPKQQKAAPVKPAVPKEQSQKIEPVKASPEMQQAKSRVQEYQKKDYSSIFNQNETDYTSKFQPSASGGAQKDPQNFADKYKFEVNTSGSKQMDTTSDNPMSAQDILKKDKQMYA